MEIMIQENNAMSLDFNVQEVRYALHADVLHQIPILAAMELVILQKFAHALATVDNLQLQDVQ